MKIPLTCRDGAAFSTRKSETLQPEMRLPIRVESPGERGQYQLILNTPPPASFKIAARTKSFSNRLISESTTISKSVQTVRDWSRCLYSQWARVSERVGSNWAGTSVPIFVGQGSSH